MVPRAQDEPAWLRSAEGILTLDRFVPHVSTVPAIRGQLVGLHLREKVAEKVHVGGAAPVVLFVHGGNLPSVAAFDLEFRDYSWMAYLARRGFDVFALTLTGYGASPRPLMDDPCNVEPAQQLQLGSHVLGAPCAPRYPFKLVTSRTEWDEIETTVDYVRRLRAVERVSLIGWSAGCPRTGGYAALHPDKVDKLILYAPTPFANYPSDEPPVEVPETGAPIVLQSRAVLERQRWAKDVRCEGQIEHPEVIDVLWRALMAEDRLGASWGRNGAGFMRAPGRSGFGWRASVPRIQAPTLMMLGEHDNYEQRLDAWRALRCGQRVLVKIACGSHFLQYERNRKVLHAASAQWLRGEAIGGLSGSELYADSEGRLSALGAGG